MENVSQQDFYEADKYSGAAVWDLSVSDPLKSAICQVTEVDENRKVLLVM
jgi:hypothetical protein